MDAKHWSSMACTETYQFTFSVGLITTLQTLPVLIFALFAGVFVDRFPKQKLVVFSQAGLMVIALALSALTFTGKVNTGM
jgi:MFS family permease